MIFDAEPIGVSCSLSVDPKTGVDVRGTSYMTFDGEKTASITYGTGNYYQAKYEVWGSDGIISLERAYSIPPDLKAKIKIQFSTQHNWDSRKNETLEVNPNDHFLEMINAFCLEIQGRKKAAYDIEKDLIDQARVMEAHRISSEEKRFVPLDEIV